MNEAGLYLHIPFCRAKCGYCAFNSVAATPGVMDDYLALLGREVRTAAAQPWNADQTFTSLFIGGGTPSLAPPATLAALLDLCRRHLTISDQAEISMEANPDSLDPAGLAILRQAGINRLSIGVQSFQDDLLTTLNRPHTGRQAVQAVMAARQSGFTNINLDLIYGLPGQSLAAWQADLRQAADLAPEHLALYELSIEPDTAFARRQAAGALPLPDEDLVADMEEAIADLLPPPFERYEISNYARPGYQCRHNLNYWQNGSYLGLGAGAVSCFDGLRVSNEPEPAAFMALVGQGHTPIRHIECLSPKGRFRESMIMGLRLLAGLDLAALEGRLGLTAAQVYGDLLTDLENQGLLRRHANRLSIAPKRLAVANQILSQLV